MEVDTSDSKEAKLLPGKSHIFSYDPFQCPAVVEMAEDHYKALFIAKPITSHHKVNIDEVSGFPVENAPLPLCCRPEDLSFISPAYPMFFQFVRYCLYVVLILFVPMGLYDMIQNLNGTNCSDIISSVECLPSFQNKSSLVNLVHTDSSDQMDDLLIFFTIVVLIIALQFMRKSQRIFAIECDERAITASDFTVKISNFPKSFDEDVDVDEAVKRYMNKHALPGHQITVKKVSCIYNCTEKLRLKALVKAKAVEKAKLLAKKAYTADVLEAEIEQLTTEITDLEIQINRISEKFKDGKGVLDQFTGEAFVSFESQQETLAVVDRWDLGFLKYLYHRVNPSSHFKYKGNMLRIIRAAEPSDVIWENAGYTTTDKTIRRILSFFAAIVILIVFFLIISVLSNIQVIVFYLIYQQKNPQNYPFFEAHSAILNSLVSFTVVVLNYALCFIMKIFSRYEKFTTYTEEFSSYSQKLAAAQFINTSVLTLYLAWINSPINWAAQGGLVTNIYNVFVINALMSWFMGAIYIWYYLAEMKRKKAKESKGAGYVQMDLNKIFENPVFDFPTKYATYTKTVLSAALYAPLVPSILPVVFVGFIGSYWVEKYNMLRRNSRGPALGPDLSLQFIETLELTLIIFAVSSYFFQNQITDSAGAPNIAAAIIGILNAILPMDWINKRLFPVDPEKIGNEKHSKVHLDFLEDYDRSNPATEETALAEYSTLKQRKSRNTLE